MTDSSALEPAPDWIKPDWPAPPSVQAVSTTRVGGFSEGPYRSLNLGDHVDDDPHIVEQNRRQLITELKLPSAPRWLMQVHQTTVLSADQIDTAAEADGSATTAKGVVCAVLTADCLPVLLCDYQGTVVAALHAGWRGLLDGVLEAGIAAMNLPGERLMAWMGPSIGPQAFEVGDDVRDAFIAHDAKAEDAFIAHNGRWLADLPNLARQRLIKADLNSIHGGSWCTYSDPGRFFSYRREPVTGRQASLIWLR